MEWEPLGVDFLHQLLILVRLNKRRNSELIFFHSIQLKLSSGSSVGTSGGLTTDGLKHRLRVHHCWWNQPNVGGLPLARRTRSCGRESGWRDVGTEGNSAQGGNSPPLFPWCQRSHSPCDESDKWGAEHAGLNAVCWSAALPSGARELSHTLIAGACVLISAG